MSSVLDQKIVSMKFDNSNFEKNAKKSLSTLDRLKEKLNFAGSTRGFEQLNGAVSDLDFSGAISGIEQFSMRFNPFFTAANRIVVRLTDSVLNLGKSLTIGQVTNGFSKYEESTTAVQTIMAATGKSIDEVSEIVERLSWFADETSYSFTDMISNIGKFAASGVDLEEAATAMEGIATWAAMSGQNPTTASHIMAELAQAMGRGYLNVQDWASVENARMATKTFKALTLQIAAASGALEKLKNGSYKIPGVKKNNIVTAENLRTTLASKWLTSDLFNKVLVQYGSYADAVNSIQTAMDIDTSTETIRMLDDIFNEYDYKDTADDVERLREALNFSIDEKEAKTLIEVFHSIGHDAFEFAQEAKTFSEVIGSVKDAVTSKYMNIFQQIFGDYQDAKVLFTNMSEELWSIFAGPIDNIGNLLKEALYHKSAWSSMLNEMDKAGVSSEKFEETLKETLRTQKFVYNGQNIDQLVAKYGSLERVSERGLITTQAYSDTLKTLGINSKDLYEIFKPISEMGGRIKLIESVSNVYTKLKNTFEKTVELWRLFTVGDESDKTRHNRLVGNIQNLIDKLYEFTSKAWVSEKASQKIQNGFSKIVVTIADVYDGIKEIISPVFTKIFNSVPNAIELIATAFEALGNALYDIVHSGLVTSFSTFVKNIFSGVGDLSGVFDWLRNAIEKIVSFFSKDNDKMAAIYDNLSKFSEKVGDIFDKIFKAFAKNFKGFNAVEAVLDAGSFSIVFSKFKSLLEEISNFWTWIGLFGGDRHGNEVHLFKRIGDELKSVFTSISELGTQLVNTKYAQEMDYLANAILKIAGALFILSFVDVGSLMVAAIVIKVVLETMQSIIRQMVKVEGDLKKGALKTINLFAYSFVFSSLAMAILEIAAAMFIISKIDIMGIVSSLVAVFALTKIISSFTKKVKPTELKGLASISVGVLILAFAMKMLANVDKDALKRGKSAINSLLIVMGVLSFALKKIDPATLTSIGNMMLKTSIAILILAASFRLMDKLDATSINNSLTLLGVTLAMIVASAWLLKDSAGAAGALILFALAIGMLVPSLLLLGTMKWESILTALGSVAGVLLIMGLAAKFLAGKEKTLLAIGGAVALIGAGLLMILAAVTALDITGSINDVAGMYLADKMLEIAKNVIPAIIDLIADGFIHFVEKIGEGAGSIFVALALIGKGIIDAISLLIEPVVDMVMKVILAVIQALNDYAFDIVDGLVTFLIRICDALAYQIRTNTYEILRSIANVCSAILEVFVTAITDLIRKIPGGKKIANAIDDYMDSIRKEVEPSVEQTGKKSGQTMTDSLYNSFSKGKDMLGAVGLGTGNAMAHGITEGLLSDLPNTETATRSLFDKVSSFGKDASKDTIATYEGIGRDTGEGYIKGIKSKLPAISSVAKEIGNISATGTKLALASKSPSKVFKEIGGYVGSGYIIGITDSLDGINDAAASMGTETINSMNNAIRNISEAIEISDDSSPVIRPVLDLTDIDNGARTINNLLGNDYAYALSGPSGKLTSNINLQNGNDSVVNAISGMRSDFADFKKTMASMTIVMDSGAVVGSLSDKIDKSLGEIAMYKGRGNR